MKTYNWGILGTGYIAQTMAEALAYVPQSKLFAVGSRNAETANAFAEIHHCKAYSLPRKCQNAKRTLELER